jgi:hypothetical protein
MSPFLGSFALILYFLVNGVFLGHAFFVRAPLFLRMTFGTLVLIMLLGFLGWAIMITYNLDALRVTLVLLAATTVSSLANRRMKDKNDSK